MLIENFVMEFISSMLIESFDMLIENYRFSMLIESFDIFCQNCAVKIYQ